MARQKLSSHLTAYRANVFAKLIAKGATRRDLLEYAEREWDLRETATDAIAKQARQMLMQDWEYDRREFMAELMAQYADLAKLGRRTGNLSVTLGSLNQMARLVKLVS